MKARKKGSVDAEEINRLIWAQALQITPVVERIKAIARERDLPDLLTLCDQIDQRNGAIQVLSVFIVTYAWRRRLYGGRMQTFRSLCLMTIRAFRMDTTYFLLIACHSEVQNRKE
jgi:hypothetical protein